MSQSPACERARGFTLLEVMLAMGLVSLVAMALMMAIDFQFRVVEATRRHVEEAQLARVLLHRIAEDLRSVASIASAGVSTEKSADTSSAESTDDEGDKSDEEKEEGKEEETKSIDTSEAKTEDQVESSTSAPTTGFCGDSDWIQFNVYRLPRADQWRRLLATTEEGAALAQAAGLRTVLYFMASEDQTPVEDTLLATQTQGLMRQETDRATALLLSPGEATDQQDAQLMAPEVTAIGFRYYDGTDWQEEWDSANAGRLPAAVEITLTLRPSGQTAEESSIARTLEEEDDSLIYRLVVALPAVQAGSKGGQSATETEAAEDKTTATENADNGKKTTNDEEEP